MITSIRYKNFKALRDCTLPLGRFTLIVGPNGSGKSTAMQALKIASEPNNTFWDEIVSVGLFNEGESFVELIVNTNIASGHIKWREGQKFRGALEINEFESNGSSFQEEILNSLKKSFLDELKSFRIFSFDANPIARPVTINPHIEICEDGENLAGVLDALQNDNPEKFNELNQELNRWLPEFDRILFETPSQGKKAFLLRTSIGRHKIKAADISHGTLLALAYLTIAYLPNPPKIVCFEEPERGIHPRLLRDVRDAMYRLAYPEEFGEKREPVQVIATTHSPYLLDLYKDHPEEIVIANKDENGVHFERLSDKPNVEEFLQEIPLGEVWYSGVLGGVPIRQ